MPNKRAAGQVLINVPMNEAFVREIDRALPSLGYDNRASFIRDAILERLAADGIVIPKEIARAPYRGGKRGQRYPKSRPSAYALNEK